MTESKRESFQMRLDPYRKKLIQNLKQSKRFKGLTTSKIVEQILELAEANPDSFDIFLNSEQKSFLLQKEVELQLGQKITEILIQLEHITRRLEVLEADKEKSLFGDELK